MNKQMIITVGDEGLYIEKKPLVKCKYCIHKDRVSDYCMYLKREVKREEFCCWGTQMGADDFCSRGEKR